MTEPCTVTGVLRDAAGDLLTSTKLSFQRLALLQAVEGDTVVAPVFGTALAAAETVTTDGTTAAFSIDLMPGVYRLSYQGGSGIESISFAVPVAETRDLAILIGQAATIDSTLIQTVLGYKQDAETARDEAQEHAADAAASAALADSEGNATIALEARQGAEAAEAGSVAAQVLSEAARDAAFAGADVYADIATGLAAVADGEQFGVVSSDGDEIIRYRRDSASTQSEMARHPTSQNLKYARSLIIGRVTSVTYAGTVPTVTLGEPGHYYEQLNGGTFKHAIAPLAAVALNFSEGITVDFVNGNVDGEGRYIPVKENIASGVTSGWQSRKKFVLVARGHSGSTALTGAYARPDRDGSAAVTAALAARRKISGSVFTIRQTSVNQRVVYLSRGYVWKENNAGSIEATIAAVSSDTLTPGNGFVIDLDNPVLDGSGHHVPQKVAIASGAQLGWQSRNRHILLAVDQDGRFFGEYAINPQIGQQDGEAAFLLTSGDSLPSWNPTTRTLTWPSLLFVVQSDGGATERIIIAAGSIVVPSPDNFYTIALDRREVVPSGTTPASAVKVGDYLASNGVHINAAHPMWIPLFAVGRGGLTYPIRFPPTIGATNGPAVISPGTYEASELVVLAGTDQVNIHAKGGNPTSSKYLRHRMVHSIVPEKGVDVWRWGLVSETVRTGDATFTSGIDLIAGGEQEMAIRFNGFPDTDPGVSDWAGGNAHGDEELFFARMLVDGVDKPLGTAATYRCRRIEFMQGSNLWEPSSGQTILAAKSHKHWKFEGNTVDLLQNLIWQGAYNLRQTYMTMLSWLRTNGLIQVSDTGYREPLFEAEDISVAGFTPTFSASRIAKASGAGGYSAEIEMLEGWDKTGRNFQFSNSETYNKFYFMVAPDGYVTTPGEVFTVRARYRIDTSN